jgi:hypothetical protein
LLRARYL